MGGLEEGDFSSCDLEGAAWGDLMEFELGFANANVPKEVTHHGEGNFRTEDWSWSIFVEIGKAADFIIVTMGEEIGFDPFLVFDEVGEIWDDIVDAWRGSVWETKSASDNKNVTIDIDGVTRFASFIEAA